MFTPLVTSPTESISDDARWYVFDVRQQLLLTDGEIPTGAQPPVPTDVPLFLGLDGDTEIWTAWAVGGQAEVSAGDDGEIDVHTWHHLRTAYGMIPDPSWVLAGRGIQVLQWARDHQFCGRCGTETDSHPTDRARQCPNCGMSSFPRISPAVIMLVERSTDRGPEVLLAWGRQFPGRFFSALAGFVEPGESLEECVAREVLEEVGIEVDDITYFGSQPWPFPHSMMIGFTARYVSGEITIQEEEIVEAGWFSPAELPPAPIGGMSIAGWLIQAWLDRLDS